MYGITEALDELSRIKIDRDFVAQGILDVANRESTSLYPWKGQFSPGLVSALIESCTDTNDVLLDPFAGSGTMLYEAARRRHSCYGVEINPAALKLASMVRFSQLSKLERVNLLSEADGLVDKHLSRFAPTDLFNMSSSANDSRTLEESLKIMLGETENSPLLENFVATTVMVAMGDSESLDAEKLIASHRRNKLKVLTIPESVKCSEVLAADARKIPLEDGVIDTVITSPPYINVFNYHQNYRKAMELMGYLPLKVATSEIGSNRKHRSNRFLTVIQYCLDLAEVLHEIKRLLKAEGRAIFVVGRESSVRGVRFKNGNLLAQIAIASAGFSIERWQERLFKNRYGQSIYEDIITLNLPNKDTSLNQDTAREVGILALKKTISEPLDANVLANIQDAISQSYRVEPSPILSASRS